MPSTRAARYNAMSTSIAISKYLVKNFVSPIDVARVLRSHKIKYVLIGAHGLANLFKEPRATQCVEVIVSSRSQRKASRLLSAAFQHLTVEDQEVVTRFRDPKSTFVVLDVVKPIEALTKEALDHTQEMTLGKAPYLVPRLEMALALKFAPMISLTRADEKKFQDAADFISMVKKAGEAIDLELVERFGELVYGGGGKELLEKVRQVRAGERLKL